MKLQANYSVPALCILSLAAGVSAQDVPVILQVDVESQVRYVGDVTDPTRVAQSPAPVPISPNRAVNFGTSVIFGDVTAVNGNKTFLTTGVRRLRMAAN